MTRWRRRDPGGADVLRPLLDFPRTEAAGGVILVDDIGAILIIAVAYSAGLHEIPLLVAASLFRLVVGAQRFGVRAVPV